MAVAVTDVVIDCLDEDVLQNVLQNLGGRIIMDKKNEGEPFLTADGYLVVRVRGDRDVTAYARELQRRVLGLRVVGTFDRTPKQEE